MHRWGKLTLDARLFPSAALAMDRPTPRNALGTALLSSASACADISDGLAQDLCHILERSGVDADVLWDAVPKHPALANLSQADQLRAAMGGGDDYELVFTAPADKRGLIEQASISALTPVTRIGRIVEKKASGEPLAIRDASGHPLCLPVRGFDHFAQSES